MRPVCQTCLSATLLVAGCASAVPAAPASNLTQQARVEVPTTQPGTLGIGDRLDIIVITAPELSREVEVGADGTIAIAYSGPVMARGRTLAELADALAEALAGELRDPRVDVLRQAPETAPPCPCAPDDAP